MKTKYTRRVIGIVRLDVAAKAEDGIMSKLGIGYKGALTEAGTFLSVDGKAPATHIAGSALLTQDERDAVVPLLNFNDNILGFRGIVDGYDDKTPVVRSGEPLPDDFDPSVVCWEFNALLDWLGLKRVVDDTLKKE